MCAKQKNIELYIGCSGYYYPAWKGSFYSNKLKPSQWLEYYSTQFNTVELNATFYRMPQLSNLKKYYQQTPPNFKFSVKMSRYVTHIKRLRDCDAEIAAFNDLVEDGLTDKLGCILFQLPASFTYTTENLAALIKAVPHQAKFTVELRHQSWWNNKTYKAFKEAGITFCNVDFPGLSSPFKLTSPIFYLRLHGNPVLFKSSYTKKQLLAFSKSIPGGYKQLHIYFNNTYYDAGFKNALCLKQIMSPHNKHNPAFNSDTI